MGVKGLWKVLEPASSVEALPRLAMDSFHTSLSEHAGYRVGIDVSIWFGHAQQLKAKAKRGEHPELQTMLFRCARLLQLPILPLFVFDGPQRPAIKRGKMSQYKGSPLVTKMKKLADAFGFQWHFAPGEAEAELAYLNRTGVIDAVWTDDVDVFLFGATTVLRNPSSTLSGNISNPVLNSEGRDDHLHVRVYTANTIETQAEIQLTRHGLILVGLLRGGDYDEGVPDIGIVLAHRIAQCGFGDTLADAYDTMQDEDLNVYLGVWRTLLIEELRTNSRGILGRKYPKVAQSFPQDFPKLDIIHSYFNPAVSGSSGRLPQFDWHRAPDISKLADVCETYFEWAYETALLQRFRSLIWHGTVTQTLRQAALRMESRSEAREAVGALSRATPEGQPSLDTSLVLRIHGQRVHASTDGIAELRLEIDTAPLVQLARDGLSTMRTPPTGKQRVKHTASSAGRCSSGPSLSTRASSPPGQPGAPLRIWMARDLVERALPQLVLDFETEYARKNLKKRARGARKLERSNSPDSDAESDNAETTSRKSARTSAKQASPCVQIDSRSKRRHTSTGSTPENDVIVISDSDGGGSDMCAAKGAIDSA